MFLNADGRLSDGADITLSGRLFQMVGPATGNWRETASRKDSTLLAQLTSGHCIRLQACKHLTDDTADPDWPRCGQAGTTDARTLAGLTWHSTSTTGNLHYH